MTVTLLFSAYLLVVASALMLLLRFSRLTSRAVAIAAGSLALWLGFGLAMGATGVAGRTDLPGIALLAGPVVLGVLGVTLTRPGAILAAGIPLSLLLGFQLFRFGVELTLTHLAGLGLAPHIMTLGGGNIEILVAATAPIAAFLATRGPTSKRIAWSWNLLGLLSLANIIVRAVLSAPGPLHLIHTEVPDRAIQLFPFTFIPGFMAPLALGLHILAFRAFRARPAP